MSEETKLVHTARLARGLTVRFEATGGRWDVHWSARPRRFTGRLRARYEAERAVFMKMWANALGANVAVVDIDSLDRVGIVEPDADWVGSGTVH